MERQSYIIAVTGGRDYTNERTIARALLQHVTLAGNRRPVLLTGGCPTGADAIAERLWRLWERPFVVDPATFIRMGRAAGPHRNKRMAIGATFAGDPFFHPDVCIAFPGGQGTRSCVEAMKTMGIPVDRITDD